jgi:hypothetical protein
MLIRGVESNYKMQILCRKKLKGHEVCIYSCFIGTLGAARIL